MDVSNHLPMFPIVSDGCDRPQKDKRSLIIRDTSTKRDEFNTVLRGTDWHFVNES